MHSLFPLLFLHQILSAPVVLSSPDVPEQQQSSFLQAATLQVLCSQGWLPPASSASPEAALFIFKTIFFVAQQLPARPAPAPLHALAILQLLWGSDVSCGFSCPLWNVPAQAELQHCFPYSHSLGVWEQLRCDVQSQKKKIKKKKKI